MSRTWHEHDPDDGVLLVTINREQQPVNSLAQSSLEELDDLLLRIEADDNVRGVLFASGKPGNFMAGADLNELKNLSDSQTSLAISQLGQRVFSKLENLSKPTVALIRGVCLGGGLEFSMACRYRLASKDDQTLLGLPEVKVGLIPGWGGTVRLPRLVGFLDALPLILSGRMLNPHQARSRGLVHDVVPPEALLYAGKRLLQEIALRGHAHRLWKRRRRPLWKALLENRRMFQRFVLSRAEKRVLAQTHGHYPAPITAISTLRQALDKSTEEQYALEAEAISQLSTHPVTTECMRLFFLQEAGKKPPESMTVNVEPNSISHAAVIGAGAMGAGIALLMARKGIWTRLKDLNSDCVSQGVRTSRQLIDKDVKRRKLTAVQGQRALDHLSPTTDYRGLRQADIVIEAIVENLDIKRQVFQDLAEVVRSTTVLATNTSSLLVDDIARNVPFPERVVGLHFFNPPHKMPLVEIVRGPHSSPEAVATAVALVRRLGKTLVVVGDCAGFLVNRLLAPYMNEAGHLLLEIADPMEIERAIVQFGMPMGPLELTELVGLDVAAHVAQNMHKAYGDRMQPARLWQQLQQDKPQSSDTRSKLVLDNQLAPHVTSTVARLRSESNQSSSGGATTTRDLIIERLIYPIINEAARCLQEGVAERPEDVDLAMVFGTGFAPFRGGPLRYADSVGLDNIVQRLEVLALEHPRFAPSDALREFAARGTGFCPTPHDQSSAAVA
ncbi:MAG: 3-hydroxyacyl-CoA dehydrogenase NAD-binding domain-containing protein [Planctomycetaceae bacterium]